jgi:pilus assembly protein Flp/PilA
MQDSINFLYIVLRGHKAKMDERGASAVEYGLLIAGIAALIVLIVFVFGSGVNSLFNDTCDSIMQSAIPSQCA